MTGRKIFELSSYGCKTACAVIFLCVATAIGAHAQVFTKLADLGGSNVGTVPMSPLVQGRDGNLYGTANGGGILGAGTVFKVTPKGTLTTLYRFCIAPNCTDGERPFGGLVLATDGNFYGTTGGGGTGSDCTFCGTVFKITPAGALTTLYNFCSKPNCADGEWPWAGLIQVAGGDFFGTTDLGGSRGINGDGTVFKITSTGTLTTLLNFDSFNGAVGADPLAPLVQGTDGNFYGTTESGGTNGLGTVFKITARGTPKAVHSFKGTDGASPYAGLIQGADGNFYGTTREYGDNTNCAYGCGTVFSITPGGILTTLHAFEYTDGAYPFAALVQATDGNFYGVTYGGGNSLCANGGLNGCGTIFQITPDGLLTTVHIFDGADGANPWGGLVQATNGVLYGTTYLGGTYDVGTIFSLDMGLSPFVTFVRAAGKVGQTGGILGQGFKGTTDVSLNGNRANFTVVSDTYIRATVPAGATTGYVTVTTPTGVLTSNVPFHVIP